MNRPTLLIVDDESEIRESIRFFASGKFHVVEAANGVEAIRLIETMRIDVILSDYNMPQMDGMELLKILVEQDYCIPVVWLTGRGNADLCRSTWAMGVYDYLEKPFNPEQLIRCIWGAVESKDALSEIRANRRISKKLFHESTLLVGSATFRQFQDTCLSKGLSPSTVIHGLIQDYLKRVNREPV